MRFKELQEQYGDPVAFRVPSKIAAVKPKPDYRQGRKMASYRVDAMPSYVPAVDTPEKPPMTSAQSKSDKPVPLRVGKELIRPNDPRHAAIMSLLARQQRQP